MSAAVLFLDEVDSTNAEARRRAGAGEAGPLWIAARRQSAGRGRRGRSWSSGEADLACTLLATVDLPMAEATGAAFVAALAVADVVETFAPGVPTAVKWPNDVLLQGRKVAGVLIESGPHAQGGVWLAVGVGLNLASAPLDTERPATCIAEHIAPEPPSPQAALAALAARFAHWEALWLEAGLGEVLRAWSARAVGIPGPCTARLPAETVEGHAEGLDFGGALRLRLADGSERHISAGDVFFAGG